MLIGYWIAYYLTTATGIGVRIVVLSVVLPYFTSIIVRTFLWMGLLGEHGLVNGVLLATGLISAPLPLTYNRPGVLLGRALEVSVDWPSAALTSLTLPSSPWRFMQSITGS
jgi:ABC-type spermidine/putrescine transport system permease subunit I